MKLVFVIGTRAELIKIFPLIKEASERGYDTRLISTGQHRLEELCESLNVKKPDVVLSKVTEKSSKFDKSVPKAFLWSVKQLFNLRNSLENDYDYVIYHGDTMSTSIAALGSSRLLKPFKKFETVHVEAGLRSGDIFEPFPEEFSRRFADWMSKINFAVTENSLENLKICGKIGKENVLVGNTVYDSVNTVLDEEKFNEGVYGVVTVHRHENIRNERRMERIVEILEGSDLELIFSMHDNTRNSLEEFGLLKRLEDNEKIEIRNLVSYPEFVNLMKDAKVLFTDGGSIQEESLALGIPCVVLRYETERKEGAETDLNYLSRFNVEETLEYVEKVVEEDFEPVKNEKSVSSRILDYLENRS